MLQGSCAVCVVRMCVCVCLCVCVRAIFGRIGSSTMEYSKACTKHRTVFKVTHYRTIVGLSSMGDVGNN